MHFTLKQLQAFVAIARDNNVSRAAETLSLSQSAVSSSLNELENQLGSPLFDRMGKRLQLNEIGHRILPHAVELLARADELERLVRSGEALGNFKVGATLTIGNHLATLIISDFMRAHPGTRVGLKVANTSQIVEGMRQFDLDIGLIEGDCYDPDLDVLPWRKDELVIFCAPEHPLAKRTDITPEDLAAENWILREPGSGTRAVFDRAVAGKLSRVNILLELEHTEAIKRAVESHLGIGCVSRLALQEAFRRGNLVELPTPWFDLNRHFHFVLHKQRYLTHGVKRFLELCQQS
ncbi:LysR family transcriptional regulator [Chitinivorax sp. B]|uniref:LysR family transcriptional regulator n=1 Tax=Chitinivorax sp. B TaxID=2502235 RepID=UPI0010F93893|nr:LysR family transcriptional regulator [Chitinivorax sp. B]